MISARKEKTIHMEKPGDTEIYQINYILVRQRYRNSVKCSRSWASADAFSDHNLVAMEMNIKWKTLRRVKRKPKWNIEHLKKNKLPFQRGVEEAMGTTMKKGMDVNQRWINFKGVVIDSAKEQIGYERKEKIKKPWVTEDMISKMDERRNWKKTKMMSMEDKNIDS